MRFQIQFDTDNDSFSTPAGRFAEIQSLFTAIGADAANGFTEGKLHDANGNRVGYWEVTGE